MHIKVLKRNQIIISVMALMLITVGYMNYSSSISKTKETNAANIDGEEIASIGDARLVNSDNTTETEIETNAEAISEEERWC